jgi:hypothetical protein
VVIVVLIYFKNQGFSLYSQNGVVFRVASPLYEKYFGFFINDLC